LSVSNDVGLKGKTKFWPSQDTIFKTLDFWRRMVLYWEEAIS